MSAHPIERRTMTRAGLVQAGAAAAAVIALPTVARSLKPGVGSVLGTASHPDAAAYLRRATYAPLVGQSFAVFRSDGTRLRLRLLEARAGSGESFSLVFRGGAGTRLESATHRLEHPALGSVELFLGPVGRPVGRREFEAVVNRTRGGT